MSEVCSRSYALLNTPRACVWYQEVHLKVSQIRHNILWKPVLEDFVSTCIAVA